MRPRRARPREARSKPGCRRAVQKRPDATLLASKIGVIWIHQGRFDEAEALCRRVLAESPG